MVCRGGGAGVTLRPQSRLREVCRLNLAYTAGRSFSHELIQENIRVWRLEVD